MKTIPPLIMQAIAGNDLFTAVEAHAAIKKYKAGMNLSEFIAANAPPSGNPYAAPEPEPGQYYELRLKTGLLNHARARKLLGWPVDCRIDPGVVGEFMHFAIQEQLALSASTSYEFDGGLRGELELAEYDLIIHASGKLTVHPKDLITSHEYTSIGSNQVFEVLAPLLDVAPPPHLMGISHQGANYLGFRQQFLQAACDDPRQRRFIDATGEAEHSFLWTPPELETTRMSPGEKFFSPGPPLATMIAEVWQGHWLETFMEAESIPDV
ncbi:MAG TPA: hypothetical protein VGD46_19600 [Rhizobacter sp.]